MKSEARPLARRLGLGAPPAFVVLLVLVPLSFSSYNQYRTELVLLYTTSALGLSIVVGYAGELLLVQPAVIAVSAYCSGLIDLHWHWNSLYSLPLSVAAGMAVGLTVSLVGLRIRGLYLGIVSLFATLILSDVANLTNSWSGGDAGLAGISAFHVGRYDQPWLTLEVTVALFVLVFAGLFTLTRSGFGLRLLALRDTPRALEASGVSISRTKLAAYAVSMVPGALVGWLFPYVNGSVGTQFFDFTFTLLLLAAVEVGGRGRLIGTAVATAALEIYGIAVGPFSAWNTVGLGAVLLVAVAVFPGGIGRSTPRPARRPPAPAVGSLTPALLEPDPVDPSEAPILTAVGITKAFGGVTALSDAGLQLHRGRIVGLIGGNGSGKTTLINAITGLLALDSGRITVHGVDAASLSPSKRARLGVSRTFQVPELVRGLSVLENVEVGLLAGLSVGPASRLARWRTARKVDEERRRRATGALQATLVDTSLADQVTDSLPLGTKRMIEIARAIASGSEVILLDEPAAGLTDTELQALGRVLQDLRDSGKAVLFVEHNVPFVLEHCDEVVLLDTGRVSVTFTNTAEAPKPPALIRYLDHVPSLRTPAPAETGR